MGLGEFLGLAIFAGDIWAIINVVQSKVSNGAKILWTILILLLPLLGLIVWFFAGPKKA